MKIREATSKEIIKALENANKKFDDNLDFRLFESIGKRANIHKVSLRVKDKTKAGTKKTKSGNRTFGACWHAHGHFFDELIKINKKAEITIFDGRKINSDGGNWEVNERRPDEPKRCDCKDQEIKKAVDSMDTKEKSEGINLTDELSDLDDILGL